MGIGVSGEVTVTPRVSCRPASWSGAPERPMGRAGRRPGDLIQRQPQTRGDVGRAFVTSGLSFPIPWPFGGCGQSPLSLRPFLQDCHSIPFPSSVCVLHRTRQTRSSEGHLPPVTKCLPLPSA